MEELLHFKTTLTGIVVGHDVKDYRIVPANWYRNKDEKTHVTEEDWIMWMFQLELDIGCLNGHLATHNNVGLKFGNYGWKMELRFNWVTNNVTSECPMMKRNTHVFLVLEEGCLNINLVQSGVSPRGNRLTPYQKSILKK